MTRSSRIVLGLCLLVGLQAADPAQAAAANPYLPEARAFYQGRDYEKCIRRLDQASRWDGNSSSELNQIELYAGLCHYQLGDTQEAAEHFQLALQLDEATALPPRSSRRVVGFFKSISARVKRKPTGPSSTTQSDAPTQTRLEPSSSPPDRTIAGGKPELRKHANFLIPGILGGVALAAAGGATAFGLAAKNDEKTANSANTFQSDSLRLGQQAQREALLANIGIGVASAAAIAAVVTLLTRD